MEADKIKANKRIYRLFEIERFLPVMTREEQEQIINSETVEFTLQQVNHWAQLLEQRNKERDEFYRKTLERQKELMKDNKGRNYAE